MTLARLRSCDLGTDDGVWWPDATWLALYRLLTPAQREAVYESVLVGVSMSAAGLGGGSSRSRCGESMRRMARAVRQSELGRLLLAG